MLDFAVTVLTRRNDEVFVVIGQWLILHVLNIDDFRHDIFPTSVIDGRVAISTTDDRSHLSYTPKRCTRRLHFNYVCPPLCNKIASHTMVSETY